MLRRTAIKILSAIPLARLFREEASETLVFDEGTVDLRLNFFDNADNWEGGCMPRDCGDNIVLVRRSDAGTVPHLCRTPYNSQFLR